MADVGRTFAGWMLWVSFFSLPLRAQTPPQISPDFAAQMIMRPQPAVDSSQLGNIFAKAEFDPPAVRPGEKTIYRVTINATQNSILWPDDISVPTELRLGPAARGQLMQPDGMPFHPLTEFIYEVTPTAAGRMVITNFIVPVGWQPLEIPAATLDVSDSAVPSNPTRKLFLEVSETNLFFGQPFHMRVLLPAGLGNQIEAIRDLQFNGTGFLTDKLATRQMIGAVTNGGVTKTAYIFETTATPMAAGPMTISAQGFTVPPFSGGPISITAGGGPITLGSVVQTSPIFLVSDAIHLNVRPLPMEEALPGFTGALGKFLADKTQLSTNRVRVGEPLHLKFGFHGDGNLTRFVPPEALRGRDWQIIADNPPGGFTFIPETEDATNTPAIPFCAFDPATKSFYDLTIPAMPVTVVGEGLPVQINAWTADETNPVPLRLSSPAPTPGKSVASLKPLQLRGWFVALQILPVIVLVALWRWDEQRRFLEAHPEIIRRRKAKRDLRAEKNKLLAAVATGDAETFVMHAAAAMRIAVAPHFPAEAKALVGGDVLTQFCEADRNGNTGDTVRKIFAAADAKFSAASTVRPDLLAMQTEVEIVLQKLKEKL